MNARVLILFTTIAALAGCASGQHVTSTTGKCLTCVNNPITGKPLNYDPTEHPESTVGASQSVSTHAKFREEAAEIVNTGMYLPTDGVRLSSGKNTYDYRNGLLVGLSVSRPSITAVQMKQYFGFRSHQEMRAQGLSDLEVKAALSEKPFLQKGDTYYMGGTFTGAAGPITAVMAVYPNKDHTLVAIKVIGYDKAYNLRSAHSAMHSLYLESVNYNNGL